MTRDTAHTELAAATGWRKPAHSQAQNACVEITDQVPGWIGVRDSKLGAASPVLACTTPEFAALVARVRVEGAS